MVQNGSNYWKEKSPGTKTFALTGKVRNTGLVEIPDGYNASRDGFRYWWRHTKSKEFKAVQSAVHQVAACLNHNWTNALDYDSLQKSVPWSAQVFVVMDEDNCIVEVARYFMTFIQAESCGKCVACREGTKQMLNIMTKIVEDRATLEDLELLEEVASVVKDASLCALGKTAANPILTTLRYFRDEYIAHIVEHRCPAGVCKAFKHYTIVPKMCRMRCMCEKMQITSDFRNY
jgi:NADH-quinone oxidoreductase subunit F